MVDNFFFVIDLWPFWPFICSGDMSPISSVVVQGNICLVPWSSGGIHSLTYSFRMTVWMDVERVHSFKVIHSPQGGKLWVVSFSLLARSYFRVLFLLPGNGCAQVYCRAWALSRGHVWRRYLERSCSQAKNHGANSTTSLPLSDEFYSPSNAVCCLLPICNGARYRLSRPWSEMTWRSGWPGSWPRN